MKNQSNEEIYIYVLSLENGKYYVGQSNDVKRRFKEHLSLTQGSCWTRTHRPIDIIRTYRTGFIDPMMALKYENDITFQWISEMGWEHVRGGDYTSVDNDEHLLSLILGSGLKKEVCPILIEEGLDILYYDRTCFTLELEDANYFVGTTRHLNLAILSELNGRGAEWTKIFKPIKLVRTVKVNDESEFEQIHLQELKRGFLEYGYQRVRGGVYNRLHEVSHRQMVYALFGM